MKNEMSNNIFLSGGKINLIKLKYMSKNIELDKFYTPKETAKKCIGLFNETFKDVKEIIEPNVKMYVDSSSIFWMVEDDIEITKLVKY